MTVHPGPASSVLQLRVDRLADDPSLMSVCPGYELTVWRSRDLARDMFDRHLASFALSYSDFTSIAPDTAAMLLRKAARAIYNTDKYAKRGEFGELFLHAVARDFFGSEPAISKIAFKDAPNDTVKGYDHVHVVEVGEMLELWLGEVKFYKSVNRAIDDVTAELSAHLSSDFLRREFIAIINKLDENWPHAESVAKILNENVSLDDIFDVITVPVLVTYESPTVLANTKVCEPYLYGLEAEAQQAWTRFSGRIDPSWPVRLRLILMPLHTKADLLSELHQRLEQWQNL